MSIIPALGKLRQEDYNFEASLDYIVPGEPRLHYKPCLKKKKKKSQNKNFLPNKVVYTCNPSNGEAEARGRIMSSRPVWIT
jgi:hypothetical protein